VYSCSGKALRSRPPDGNSAGSRLYRLADSVVIRWYGNSNPEARPKFFQNVNVLQHQRAAGMNDYHAGGTLQ
jgi:hypothetical protein